MNTNKSQTKAQKQLEALQVELQTKMASIHAKKENLEKRNENLLKRRQSIFEKAEKRSDTAKRQRTTRSTTTTTIKKEKDIAPFQLNVGGTKMVVLRETLTSIKDSRLHFLFNGTMDDKLLRDEEGRVFMDVDPYYFKKVIEYLYLAKLSGNGKENKLPFMVGDEKKIFDIYLDFFGLCKSSVGGNDDDSKTPIDPNNSDNDNKMNTSKCQEELLMSFETSCAEEEKELSLRSKKLDELEGKLASDEKVANYFTTDVKTSLDPRQTSTCQDADAINVLNLYMNDKVVTVKRSILQDSYLAKNLHDTNWLERNSMKCSDGRKAIIIEYCSTTFKSIINQLRLMAIMKPHDLLPPFQMDRSENNAFLEEDILSKIFPDKQEFSFILGKTVFDSAILTSKSEGNHIKTWLGEVNRQSEPELLYRGSRDGWRVSDFHGKCDGKGVTVTIVKTSDGYVFGGYSDQSWDSNNGLYISSNEAFLFSLKCHGGLAPTKMKIKSGRNQYAMYDCPSLGPTFGGGSDLRVGYSNGTLKKGYTNLNNTYDLPAGASNTFLTGKDGNNNQFEVAEVEVFKV